jgi:hypothetical protein
MAIAFDVSVTLIQLVACVYFGWCVKIGYRRVFSVLTMILTALMVVIGVTLIYHDFTH